MATYSTDLSTLTTAESGTWTEFAAPYNGGGTPASNAEGFIQGTACYSQTTGKAVGLEISIVFDYGSNYSFTAGYAVFAWCYYANGVNLESYANSGWRFGIGSSVSAWDWFRIGGSDYGRNPYGGWMNVAIDPTATESGTIGGGNGGSYRYFGSVPYTLAEISKGEPSAVDAIRAGRGIISITGTGGSFTELAQYNDYNAGGTPPGSSSTSVDSGRHRLGLFQAAGKAFLWKGLLSLGTTGASVTFSGSNTAINIDDCPHTYPSFNKIEVNNASSSVTWTNVSIFSGATTANGIGHFEMVANATVTFSGCTFVDMGTFIFLSNASVTNSTFQGCQLVDSGGGTWNGTKILESTVVADASAFEWDSATDPDGYMDDMQFSEGANAHHAIEFGLTSPTTINLNGIQFTGFATTNGQNNSTFYIARTTGTVTINTSGCSGNLTYKTAGATVTINQDQVNHKLTGLINGSEVTYMKRGTAVDTGSDGSTTTNSRSFVTTNSWTPNAYKGHLLYITSGSDAGRYYVSGNSATTLYLDTEMTATGSSLTWELYDENDDTEVFHVESVTGNQSQYTYTYGGDVDVDITIISTDYEQVVLEDVTLGNSSQSIPISQIFDNNYYNP